MTRGANVMFRKKRFGWNLTVGIWERLKSMTELKEQGHKLLTSFSKKDINSLKEKKILKILMPHQYHTIAKECCLFF